MSSGLKFKRAPPAELKPGSVFVVEGPPATGKTAWVRTWAPNVVEYRHGFVVPVVYADGARQLMDVTCVIVEDAEEVSRASIRDVLYALAYTHRSFGDAGALSSPEQCPALVYVGNSVAVADDVADRVTFIRVEPGDLYDVGVRVRVRAGACARVHVFMCWCTVVQAPPRESEGGDEDAGGEGAPRP